MQSSDETQQSQVVKSDLQRKIKNLFGIAIVLGGVNLFGGLIRANENYLSGMDFLIYALVALIVPLLLVQVTQVVPLFRNNYIRLHVFIWPSAFFALGNIWILRASVYG